MPEVRPGIPFENRSGSLIRESFIVETRQASAFIACEMHAPDLPMRMDGRLKTCKGVCARGDNTVRNSVFSG